jgi:EAL domain-containing protein (putative c-di-GMP-specific phosphodiesterase class I)
VQRPCRIYLVLFGAALVLWLMALPFASRVAREVVLSWVPGRRRVRHTVRRALAHDQIVLVYQPQVSPADSRCHAVEALVRMRDAGQLRSPDAFLPHIDGTSLDAQLADRVVELALAQLAQWRTDGYTLRMSVNLSTANLADPRLPNRLAAGSTVTAAMPAT